MNKEYQITKTIESINIHVHNNNTQTFYILWTAQKNAIVKINF